MRKKGKHSDGPLMGAPNNCQHVPTLLEQPQIPRGFTIYKFLFRGFAFWASVFLGASGVVANTRLLKITPNTQNTIIQTSNQKANQE